MQTVDLRALDLESGHRVLDLGCGSGRHLRAVQACAPCHAVGLDLAYDDVRAARAALAAAPDGGSGTAVSLSVGDALALPFADAAFDRVICSEVLEHIPRYGAAVAEIARVLKLGGMAAVSVPRYWPERVCWALSDAYHDTPGGHVRIFRTPVLRRALEAQGLRCIRRHWAHGLHSPYWWLKCIRGVDRADAGLLALYHRFLVWDLMKRPRLTRILEKLADPLMGKSIVLYARKDPRP